MLLARRTYVNIPESVTEIMVPVEAPRVRDPRGKTRPHSPQIGPHGTHQRHPHGRSGRSREGQSHQHPSEDAGDAPSVTMDAGVRMSVYTKDHKKPLVFVRLIAQARLW